MQRLCYTCLFQPLHNVECSGGTHRIYELLKKVGKNEKFGRELYAEKHVRSPSEMSKIRVFFLRKRESSGFFVIEKVLQHSTEYHRGVSPRSVAAQLQPRNHNGTRLTRVAVQLQPSRNHNVTTTIISGIKRFRVRFVCGPYPGTN